VKLNCLSILGRCVAVATVACFVGGCATSSKPWGIALDPSAKCTIAWTNNAWSMSLPVGILDLSPYQTRDNLAPRVLRPVTGDFEAEVKVTGDFDPGLQPVMAGRAAFFGAGLLLWESATNYVRLERNEWTFGPGSRQRHGPLFEHWFDNRNLVFNPTLSEPFFRGDSTWLRLTRTGDQLSAAYSHDGLDWVTYKTIEISMGKDVEIGVAAISTSAKPLGVTFSNFQVRAGQKL
jgi:Protein of unknown function (DUF1349)